MQTASISEHFTSAPAIFTTSPLYRTLCGVVAGHQPVLDMLTARRPGQQPSYLFFGAVHALLLGGADHPLRDFYPSVVGDAALDPSRAGPVLIDFCRRHHDELAALIRTRLVQTNVARRAAGLRFALWAIGQRCRQPVHLIEVGASAGMLLLADRYRYLVGGQVFGPDGSAVLIDTEWRGAGPPPDLDDVPPIASRVGVDLHPVDVTDPAERQWLKALVWPEDQSEAALLTAALAQTAEDPPHVMAGDAIDVCPGLGQDLPGGEPRVVFHAATRMHVPAGRRRDFDNAIDSIGGNGPLYHAWIEPPSAPHHPHPPDDRGVLQLHGPGNEAPAPLVRLDGHLRWLEPLS